MYTRIDDGGGGGLVSAWARARQFANLAWARRADAKLIVRKCESSTRGALAFWSRSHRELSRASHRARADDVAQSGFKQSTVHFPFFYSARGAFNVRDSPFKRAQIGNEIYKEANYQASFFSRCDGNFIARLINVRFLYTECIYREDF